MNKFNNFVFFVLFLIFSLFLVSCGDNSSQYILPEVSYETNSSNLSNKTIILNESNNFVDNNNLYTLNKEFIDHIIINSITKNKKYPSNNNLVIVKSNITNKNNKEVNLLLYVFKLVDDSINFKKPIVVPQGNNIFDFNFTPTSSGSYIFSVNFFDPNTNSIYQLQNITILVLKNDYKETKSSFNYTIKEINCTDYDGKDFFKKTSCFDTSNFNGISDYCVDNETVVDYGCVENECVPRVYHCPGRCLYGACVLE